MSEAEVPNYRFLTTGEKNLVAQIFGGSIGVDDIKIYNNKTYMNLYWMNDAPHAPNGNIYFPKDYNVKHGLDLFNRDFSVTETEADRDFSITFIHEMTHVWQFQHGVDVSATKLNKPEKHNYNYHEIFEEGGSFNKLTMEKQAEFISNYYAKTMGIFYKEQQIGLTLLHHPITIAVPDHTKEEFLSKMPSVDFLNNPTFDHDLYWYLSDPDPGSRNIGAGESSEHYLESTLKLIGNDNTPVLHAHTIGFANENMNPDEFYSLITSPLIDKSDRVSLSWDLYSVILKYGTYNAQTGIQTLGDYTVQPVVNQYGGQSFYVSKDGQAFNAIAYYGEENFQQQVMEIIGADGRTEVAEIVVADTLSDTLYRGHPVEITYPENFIFGQVGGFIGNIVGQKLENGNVAHDILVSSVTNALGENLGEVLDFLSTGENNLWQSFFDPIFGVQGTNQLRADIIDDVLENIQAGIASAVAGSVVNALGDTIKINGLAGEIFNVIGGTITTGIVSEGVEFLFHGMNAGVYSGLASGSLNFSTPFYTSQLPGGGVLPGHVGPPIPNTTVGDYLQLQIFNAFAAYAGSKLAGEVIHPESEAAALFGAAGSAIGTFVASTAAATGSSLASLQAALQLGTAFGPIGIAVGVFIGTVFGTALGNALGSEEHPSSWGFLHYDVVAKQYYVTGASQNDGGGLETGRSLATALANGINQIIAQTHGTLRSTSVANDVTIGFKQGEFIVEADGGSKTFDNSGEAISYAAFKMLKDFDLVGGHAVIMRAWHNSDAHNLEEFKEDIQVAEAFMNYLQNPAGILALMMDQPDSQLAQSWAVILQRAAELKLHVPNDYDFDGGWNEVLIANGINPESLANIEDTTLTVTDPVTGHDTVFHHLIGPGYEIVRIEGTDGNDIINVKIDGPSISYVDAGSGNDVINGSEDRDIIFGGSGDDTINGNGGDDWLNGGPGNDNINGNNGLDLIVGGDDNDVLTGGAHADSIYGGKGNDILWGGVESDHLYGGEGNDELHGDVESSIDYLYGGKGNDTIYGYDGDILVGGAGDDHIIMGSTLGENAGVKIARGDGHDTIEFTTNIPHIIDLESSIGLNDVWFHLDPQNSNNMIISILGEDQSFTVVNYKSADVRVAVLNDFYIKLSDLDTSPYASLLSVHPVGQYNTVTQANQTAMANALMSVWHEYIQSPNFLFDQDTNIVHMQDGIGPELTINYSSLSGTISSTYNNYKVRLQTAYTYNLFMKMAQDVGGSLSGYLVTGSSANDVLSAPSVESGAHENAYSAFIYGGAGDDTITGGNRSTPGYYMDVLVGGLGNDNISGDDGNDRIWGGDGADSIDGGNQDDLIFGGAGSDTVYGGAGNDTIDGGDGDDALSGDDRYNSTLYPGKDIVNGGAGNDLIYGGASDDTLDGGTGNDIIYGGTENDVLLGGEGDDILYGEAGDDMQAGDAGNDIIYGSAGNDIIDGGSGNDTVNYSGSTAAVIVNLATRTLSGGDAAGDTITGIENLIGSGYADTLTGDSNNNVIDGGNGNDVIEGGAGDDTLISGSGTDTASYSLATSSVSVSLLITTAQNTGGAGTDALSGFERLTGSNYADTLIGDANANMLTGGEGDDILEGGAGDDVLYGGNGYDTASYKNASAVTVSLAVTASQNTVGAGWDTLSSIQNLIGSAGNDTLTGNTSDNVIEGGAGNDVLNGGNGTDTVSYSLAGSAVSINLATTTQQNTGGAGLDTITAFENIIGSSSNDALTGDANNNIIEGGDGNDTIDGAAGTDTASYKSASSGVTVSLAITTAQNTLGAGTDTILNTERLIGSAKNDILTGNSGTNQIEGGAGDDIMDGGAGTDTLAYQTATSGVTVSLLLTDAQDTIGAGKDTIINFESITGSAYNDVLIGNTGSNTLKGGDGNDTLDGGAGNDTIAGENGVDTVSYLSAASAVTVNLTLTAAQNTGGGGTDTITTIENITGSDYNDTLTGDSGANTLKGGSGNDLLEGGAGDDSLYGDFGIDTASYAAAISAVTINLATTTIQNTVGAGNDLLKDVENIIGSAYNDTLTGDDKANQIEGGAGDDVLNGGSEKDTLSYKLSAAAVTVSLAITTAQNTGGAGIDTISLFENILGSAYNDTLTGDSNDNVIEGCAGNDILNGGAGIDTVSYVNAASAITVNVSSVSAQNTVGAGTDTLSNFENILGSSFNDTLTGNSGDNVIEGGAGNDIMDGGAGIDTVSYASSSAGITVSLAITTTQNTIGAGTDTITNFENILGSQYSDILTGNSAANQIEGGAGDDVLDGGAGVDTLTYLNAGSGVTINLALTSAQNTGGAGSDTIYSFENLIGSAYNDVLTGDGNANIIKGGDGNDTIEGGDGNDTLYGEAGTDTLSYASAGGAITVSLAVISAQNTGGAGTDTIATFENIKGSAFDDTLFGDAGVNFLYGGAGNDILEGAGGDDSLYGEAGTDTASYAGATSAVTVNLTTTTSQNTGGAGSDLLKDIENIIGSAYNDTLTGDDKSNQIEGGAGNDILNGGVGVDTVSYLSASSAVTVNLATLTAQNTVGAGSDTITNFENILGSAYNDTLTGDANANVIEGGNGNDVLNGAAGIDTLSYSKATAAVTVNLATTTAQNTISAGSDTVTGFENLTGSAYGDTLTGDAGDNTISGGDGNDVIQGGLGNDILYGNAGTDTLSYASAAAGVTVNISLSTAQNTVSAGTDTVSGFENLTGSGYADTLTGDSNNNVIDGGSSNDVIEGGAGDDTLIGGSGTDTASYASATSAVSLSLAITAAQNTLGAGTDTLSGFERITGSIYADTLIGDANANVLTGGDGDDILEGGAGDDTLYGGNGYDTARYSSATSAVTVSLALTAVQNTIGAGNDKLDSIQNLIGSAYNDTLTGNTSDNVIEGGLGNDILNGGNGTDTVSYSLAASGVSINLATTTQQNTLGAGLDTITAFENITGSAYNDTLTGDGNTNVIEGGAGNDTIDGAAGTDTANYMTAISGVVVSLAVTAAQDTIGAGIDTLSNFERLIGSSFHDTLTGNSGTNQIEGGAGNDIMDGGAGTDTLAYQTAISGVTVSLAITTAQNTHGAGTDTITNFESITGSAYDDDLTGNSGSNTLKGGTGNDTLFGGGGTDTLYGETGSDTFGFDHLTAFSAQDTISDFSLAQGDKLDISDLLSGYDALTSVITDFVRITDNGTNSFLAVDFDGGANNFIQIATLSSVIGLTDEAALKASGNLVTV